MKDVDSLLKKANRTLIGVSVVVFGALALYVIWFFAFQGMSLSGSPDDWGAAGDYFGGFVNPLIALLALVWLIRAVLVQREEMKGAQTEIQQTREVQQLHVLAQLLATRVQSYQTRLQVISLEIQSYRDDIEYLRAAMSEPTAVDLVGNLVFTQDNKEEIDALIEQCRLRTEMMTTIDNLMKEAIEENERLASNNSLQARRP